MKEDFQAVGGGSISPTIIFFYVPNVRGIFRPNAGGIRTCFRCNLRPDAGGIRTCSILMSTEYIPVFYS